MKPATTRSGRMPASARTPGQPLVKVPALYALRENEPAQEQENKGVGVGRCRLVDGNHVQHRQQGHGEQGGNGNRERLGHPPGRHEQRKREHSPGIRGHPSGEPRASISTKITGPAMNPSCTRQWLTVAISDGSVEVRDMPENLLNRLIQYPVSIIVAVTVSL